MKPIPGRARLWLSELSQIGSAAPLFDQLARVSVRFFVAEFAETGRIRLPADARAKKPRFLEKVALSSQDRTGVGLHDSPGGGSDQFQLVSSQDSSGSLDARVPMPTYNPQTAVAYAKKWADSPNKVYRDFSAGSGDCTNFVSQCLYHGGWPMIEGYFTHTRYDISVWYYNLQNTQWRGVPCSRTWAGAPEFAEFCRQSVRAQLVYNDVGLRGALKIIEPGDIVQLGAGEGDNFFLRHSLIVTHVDKSNPHNSTIHQHGDVSSRVLTESTLQEKYSHYQVIVWHPFRAFSD